MMRIKHIYLIFIPAIIIVSLALLIRVIQYDPLFPKTEETNEEQKNSETNLIPIFPEDPIIGNKKAALTIFAIEDFACEACKEQNSILEKLMEKYPDKIKIVWKGLPVNKFPFDTNLAQEYAFCANEQGKFLDFKNLAFAKNSQLTIVTLAEIKKEIESDEKKFDACLDSGRAKIYVKKVEDLAAFLNIQSVPTFFFNKKQINPKMQIESWENILSLQ